MYGIGLGEVLGLNFIPKRLGPPQPYPRGKGVRTTTSKYMPHQGKNIRYATDHLGNIHRASLKKELR